jgi:hypothetical protein
MIEAQLIFLQIIVEHRHIHQRNSNFSMKKMLCDVGTSRHLHGMRRGRYMNVSILGQNKRFVALKVRVMGVRGMYDSGIPHAECC